MFLVLGTLGGFEGMSSIIIFYLLKNNGLKTTVNFFGLNHTNYSKI